MPRRSGLLAVSLALAAAAPALAQTDPMAMARVAAANQLGVLEYCQAQGFVGADAVSAEQESIARLPPSSASTGDAEALGKQGTMAAPNGTRTTLASLAGERGTTVSALCQQMGSSATQAAAAMRQNGMGTGMPTVPGMPAMPGSMPSGGAMPPMPAMPAMPGAPPAR